MEGCAYLHLTHLLLTASSLLAYTDSCDATFEASPESGNRMLYIMNIDALFVRDMLIYRCAGCYHMQHKAQQAFW